MISVETALEHLFALAKPLGTEKIPLRSAAGRWLAHPLHALHTQPPFPASAMDGYALRAVEAEQHAQFKVIGEAAAGHPFSGNVAPGQAVRIFTGAPLPDQTDFVVIQEDTDRTGDVVTLTETAYPNSNVRPAGNDFSAGTEFMPRHHLGPNDVALLAAMGHAEIPVHRKPVVAILPTGDELVQPGEVPRDGQIIASNSYGLAALFEAAGAVPRLLPIAKDTAASLTAALERAADADLIVTIGGASVGDHDLVGHVAEALGMERAFYKIAMRPGKPLMAGRLRGTPMVGLPGNPVSAMVCGTVFVLPMLRVMLGQPATRAPRQPGVLNHDLPQNGPREHYMRAHLSHGQADVFERQDSALLHVLSQANALCVRPPHDRARVAGETLEFILL